MLTYIIRRILLMIPTLLGVTMVVFFAGPSMPPGEKAITKKTTMVTPRSVRILLMIPTLLGVTMVVFFVMAFSPGGIEGPALNLDSEMKAESRKGIEDYYNKRYGLDKPVAIQYVRWLNKVSPIGFRSDEETG